MPKMYNKIKFPPKVARILKKHITCLNSLERDRNKLEKQQRLIKVIQHTAQELVLWMANFKCEKCGSEKNLTLHHFVGQHNIHFVNFIKYFKQRNYYGNQCILCLDCHGKADFIDKDNHQVISPKKVDEVKKKLIGEKKCS